MAVPLADAVLTLYPAARPLVDFSVAVDAAGDEVLTKWAAATLGPRPSRATLAAVTAPQAAAARRAAVRSAADADILSRGDQTAVLVRAALRVVHASLSQLRAAAGLPPVSWAQVLAAVSQQVAAGGGDPEA